VRTEAHRSPHVNYIDQRSKNSCDSFANFQPFSRPAFHLTDLSPEEEEVRQVSPDWDTAKPQNKYQSFIPVKRKVLSVSYRIVDYPKDVAGSFFLKIQRYCLYNRILYQKDFTLHTNDQEMLNMCHICLYPTARSSMNGSMQYEYEYY
jgi:hypothetical protein